MASEDGKLETAYTAVGCLMFMTASGWLMAVVFFVLWLTKPTVTF